jgi:hypothetical protein
MRLLPAAPYDQQSISAQLDTWLAEDDSRGTASDGAEVAAEVQHGRNAPARPGAAFAKDVQEMKGLLLKLQNGEIIN